MIIYPRKKWALLPKNGHLRTFYAKMSRVAFTRFCHQIHQCARIGVRGGGVKPILAMPRFSRRFKFGHPSLSIAVVCETPPTLHWSLITTFGSELENVAENSCCLKRWPTLTQAAAGCWRCGEWCLFTFSSVFKWGACRQFKGKPTLLHVIGLLKMLNCRAKFTKLWRSSFSNFDQRISDLEKRIPACNWTVKNVKLQDYPPCKIHQLSKVIIFPILIKIFLRQRKNRIPACACDTRCVAVIQLVASLVSLLSPGRYVKNHP